MFLKLDHLRRGDHQRDRDHPAHQRAAAAAAASTRAAAPTTGSSMIEMHISEIGFCSGHSASGVWVERARARPRSRASTPPATWPACRTTTCSAPSSTAASPARTRPTTAPSIDLPEHRRGRRRGRAGSACSRRRGATDGLTALPVRIQGCAAWSTTTCSRPRSPRKMEIGLERLRRGRARTSMQLVAARPARADARAGGPVHPRLRRAGGARLALPHREPLGPLPPARRLSRDRQRELVLPQHALQGRTTAASRIASAPVAPYIVPVDADEMSAYHHLRIKTPVAAE